MVATLRILRAAQALGRRRTVGVGFTFWSVSAAFMIAMLGTTVPTPLYPLYRKSFGLSTLMITAVFAAYVVGVLLTLIAFGPLSDRVGRRRVLIAGLATALASTVIFLFAGSVVALFAARLLSGITAGLFTSTASAALVDLERHGDTRRATTVSTASNIGGLGAGPLLAGVLAQYAPSPLRLIFVVEGALLVLAGIAVASMREPRRSRPGAGPPPRRLAVPAQMRAVFIRAAAAAFTAFAVLGLFTALAPSLLAERMHISNTAISGGVVALAFAASSIAQLALHRVADRRAVMTGAVVLAVGAVLAATAVTAGSFAILLVSAGVSGLGQGLAFMGSLAVISRQAPAQSRAEVIATYFVAGYAGVAVPVVGVGLLSAPLGLAGASVVFAAVIAVLSLLLAGDAMRARSAAVYGPAQPCSRHRQLRPLWHAG